MTATGSTKERVGILHSMPIWLPLTSPWLYHLVRHLPAGVDSHIVCERVSHLDQFAISNLNCLRQHSRPRYIWEKGLRKLGLRQHLPYVIETGRRAGVHVLHSHWGDVAWKDRGAACGLGVRHVCTFYGKEKRVYGLGRQGNLCSKLACPLED